jgi:L-2,4-diaminobutyrate decarboxylase
MRQMEAGDLLQSLGGLFLAADGSNSPTLMDLINRAITTALSHQGDGPTYLGVGDDRLKTVAAEQLGRFLSSGCRPEQALDDLPVFLRGGVKPHHPLLAKNIIPLPAFIYIAAQCAASLFMGNGVSGEDAGSALAAETLCSDAIARLIGYDTDRAGGLFTFGGTGTNLYALRIGITKADPGYPQHGIRTRGVVVGSWPGHYSHQTATMWLGVGRENYLAVPSHTDQTTDLTALEGTCRRLIGEGRYIYAIVGVAGTTSNMAVDDFAAITAIRDRLVTDYGLKYVPHVHADAVLGWAYLTFLDYDFTTNPFRLSDAV